MHIKSLSSYIPNAYNLVTCPKYFVRFFYFFLFSFFQLIATIPEIDTKPYVNDPESLYLNLYLRNINKGLNYLDKQQLTDLDSPEVINIVDVLVEVRRKELEHSEKYQFLHAQDSLYFAYEVIAKELVSRISESRRLNRPSYEYLRYPSCNLLSNRDDFFNTFPELVLTVEQIQQLIENPDIAQFAVNDFAHSISRHILSCNLSMETAIPMDSALYVFIAGKGIANSTDNKEEYEMKMVQHFAQLFDSAGINPSIYQEYLTDLVKNAPRTKEGIINQIFLPKHNIKKYLYMSFGGGFLHPLQDALIHEIISQFQIDRLNPDFAFDNNIQVRILVGALDDDEVVIYRYSLIHHLKQQKYIDYARNIIDIIFESSNLN